MFRLVLLSLVCWIVAAATPAYAQEPGAETEPEQAIRYDVEVEGVTGRLKDLLESVSLLKRQQDSPPRSFGALRSRVRQDIDTFRRALRSEGYYDAQILQRVDREEAPVTITLRVFAGPRYTISDMDLEFIGAAPPGEVVNRLRQSVELSSGDPVRASDIIAGENRILSMLLTLGYPLAVTAERTVTIDHDTDTARVVYRFDAGPRVRFGETVYTGAPSVDRKYLRRLRPWKPGDIYDQTLVEQYRRRLVRTRLFGSAAIGFVEPPDAVRRPTEAETVTADMEVALTQAALRTISVGVGFSTSEGIGGEVSWEHRNLFGAQERLTLTGTAAQIEQSLIAGFRKPHFRRLDQLLTAELGFIRQDTDAFDSLEARGGAGLERVLSDAWTASLGANLAFTRVEDAQGRRTFGVADLPIAAIWDIRDDILDATEGARVRVAVAPSLGVQDDIFTFVKNELDTSAYYAVDDDKDIVLAARLKLGSIVGANRATLPATRLFFAGGGGSIRGFGFQDVGPRDAEGNPLGGRSLVEVAFEPRFRVTNSIGLVPFIEGGQVYRERVPQFNDFRWGAGLGVRYFTGFAPIRLDVGFPLNPRPGDEFFQIYVSLGQSF